MTLPKNAQEPNLPPQNSTVIAITIAATTFVVHPLCETKQNKATVFLRFLRLDLYYEPCLQR